MRYLRRHHLALVALFIALGGTSYAAIKLPANSVGTRQIKNRAVTRPKIAPSALSLFGGPEGPKGERGADGQPGEQGEQGAPGPGAKAIKFTVPASDDASGESPRTTLGHWDVSIACSDHFQEMSLIVNVNAAAVDNFSLTRFISVVDAGVTVKTLGGIVIPGGNLLAGDSFPAQGNYTRVEYFLLLWDSSGHVARAHINAIADHGTASETCSGAGSALPPS